MKGFLLLAMTVVLVPLSPGLGIAWVDPTFLNKWGSPGSGPGQFDDPHSIATDVAGNVYVADGLSGRVEVFTGGGTFIRQFQTTYADPQLIAVGPDGSVYTADGSQVTAPVLISRFDAFGNLLSSWGGSGGGAGQFRAIAGLAVDRAGTVYVSDIETDPLTRSDYTRIQLFDADGTFLSAREIRASAPGQLLPWYYAQLATDGSDNLIAAISVNSPSQGWSFKTFNPDGSLRASWDAPAGSSLRQIAADGAGDVLAADWINYRVIAFSARGAFLGSWGALGNGPSLFREPYGIALDRIGDTFVLDRGQGSSPEVQKFATSTTPTARTTWGRLKRQFR